MESHYAFLPSTLDMFAEFMTMLAFRLELYPVFLVGWRMHHLQCATSPTAFSLVDPPACTSFAHLGFTDLADSCGGLFIENQVFAALFEDR